MLTFVRLSYGPLALRDFAYCRSDKSQSAPCHPPTQAAGTRAMLPPKFFIYGLYPTVLISPLRRVRYRAACTHRPN
jgi:hypothetical protein